MGYSPHMWKAPNIDPVYITSATDWRIPQIVCTCILFPLRARCLPYFQLGSNSADYLKWFTPIRGRSNSRLDIWQPKDRTVENHFYIQYASSQNPRFTERTSTNLGRSHRLPHVCTTMVYGKLGGYCLQEKSMIYLIPERRLCFLFDQASSLQDSELSEKMLLENVLCKSFFKHGQPACSPATSTQPLSSSPGVQPKCYGAC